MGMRWAGWTHVNAATGALGGPPYGATKQVRGVTIRACGGQSAEMDMRRAEARIVGGRRGRRRGGGERGALRLQNEDHGIRMFRCSPFAWRAT
eukprot:4821460-Pyramimonas_sp.AAC.1